MIRPAKRRRRDRRTKVDVVVERDTKRRPNLFDAMPNEILVHILSLGPTDAQGQDAFIAATRSVSRRWRRVASVVWPAVSEHAYGRCLQFLGDVDPTALHRCRSKRQVITAARRLASRRPLDAGPDLVRVELRPYDYATALDDAFYHSAGVTSRQIRAERCPGCRLAPTACACSCDPDCWDCEGGPLVECEARNDRWRDDHVDSAHGETERPRLASDYGDLDDVVSRRRREATRSPRARWRGRELSYWHAAIDAPRAKVYVARCAQTLLTHALVADADDIGRMSCVAVIRRAHRLHHVKAELDPPTPCAIGRDHTLCGLSCAYKDRRMAGRAEMSGAYDLDHT